MIFHFFAPLSFTILYNELLLLLIDRLCVLFIKFRIQESFLGFFLLFLKNLER